MFIQFSIENFAASTNDEHSTVAHASRRKRSANKLQQIHGADTTDPHVRPQDKSNVTERCCEQNRIRCKCDFSRCQMIECPANQFLHILSQATKIPGKCCAHYACHPYSPVCFSEYRQRYYNRLDEWEEDPCTQCKCNEMGEKRCEVSHCKPLNCEDKQYIDGQCCPICDTSNSRFCAPDKVCDIHCKNYMFDESRNCTLCRCATAATTNTTTQNSTISNYVPVQTSTTDNWTNAEEELTDPLQRHPNGAVNGPQLDYTWLIHLFLGICITTGAFVVIMSITCRHICHQKGKHTLNHKQNTPLI